MFNIKYTTILVYIIYMYMLMSLKLLRMILYRGIIVSWLIKYTKKC